MIDKIKKLYPDYIIFIKRKGKIFDLTNKEVTNNEIFKKYSYVIIKNNSYEVHTKVYDSNYKKKFRDRL